jgi:Xaa-Pro aminopeptidase
LAELPRFADGIVPQRLYALLARSFPDAELVDCTSLLDSARYVKSAEEIAFVKRGVALAEDAIRALYATARPGVAECAVYAKMIEAMVAQGGELPAMIMWTAGAPGPSLGAAPPTLRPLASGDMIRVEVEGRWAGYCGQVTQMASLGAPPAAFRDVAHLLHNALRICLEKMKPGVSLGELADATEAGARGSGYEIKFLMHGRGLGDDAPIYVFNASDAVRAQVIEENTAFVVKPVVKPANAWHPLVCWGDSVVVTERGAQRLGSLPLGIETIG